VKIDLKHIAQLAKLHFEDSEIADFERGMSGILEMVDKLPKLPDDGFLLDPKNVMRLRPDDIAESLSRDDVLANAPQKQAGCVVVPKTV
jgi:aspartyl-tRNA(Asn)/glutamyl-tRNA(Gln) amidotransferase subunit C